MPAEKLRDPENLYSPPSFSEEQLSHLVEALTPTGGRAFARDVISATVRAKAEGDLRPINLVVESWYRTLLFLSRDLDDKWAGLCPLWVRG
jgi:hypothetical protein